MRAYAQQAGDPEFTFWAGEIKLRAERKVGGLLREMAASGERKTSTTWSHRATSLSDLKVTKSQSSRWQEADGFNFSWPGQVAVCNCQAQVARNTISDWLEPNVGTDKRFHLDIRQKLTKAEIGDPIKVTLGTLKLPTGRPAQPV